MKDIPKHLQANLYPSEIVTLKEGDPSNLKVCESFHQNERIIVETVLSMLTTVCHFMKVMHRV